VRCRRVRIVRGFAGWWIRRLCVHLLPEQRFIGAYMSSGRAVAAAKKRGYRVESVEE
jgi:hypothetical protein